jgi:hypothetical protein
VTDLSCLSYKPILWSSMDTDRTIVAIKGHNAIWLALCAK